MGAKGGGGIGLGNGNDRYRISMCYYKYSEGCRKKKQSGLKRDINVLKRQSRR